MVDGIFIFLVSAAVVALVTIANRLFANGGDSLRDKKEGHNEKKLETVQLTVVKSEASLKKTANTVEEIPGKKKLEVTTTLQKRVWTVIKRISRKYNHLLLFELLVILTCLFGYISIYKLGSPNAEYNSFYNYYLLQYFFLKKILLTIAIAVGVALSLIIVLALLKKKRFKKKYAVHSFSVVAVIILAFNISFLAIYAFSFVETRYLQYEISSNQETHGLIWGNDKLVSKLESEVASPRIVKAEENPSNQIVRYIVSNRKNRGDYYLQKILNGVLNKFPTNLGIPSEAPLFMYSDNLYIRKLEKDSYAAISPILGKLLVKGALPDRNIKDEPSLLVMDREEYNTFRIDQINEHIAKMKDAIARITKVVNSYYSAVSYDKGRVNYNVGMANSMIAEGNSAYSSCIRAQSCTYNYIPGTCTYYPYVYCSPGYSYQTCLPRYTPSYCSGQMDFYYNLADGYNRNANEWRDQLGYDQYYLGVYVDLRDTVETYKAMAEASKEDVPYELGLFQPDLGIKVVLESDNPETVADNIGILVHEYLHYTSYVPDMSLPTFFEEGLTEYFSREIVDKNMGVKTKIGYPLITKVIERMTEKISEQEFRDIYFSKNSALLTSTLDRAYGKDFSKKYELYFEFISYLPPKDALEITNKFLDKIGVEKIVEEDLYSKASEFNAN